MLCSHKVRKIYRIRLFDSNLNAVQFDSQQAPNSIIIRPELFQKAVQYLQPNSEIIMKVMQSSISMENIPVENEVRAVSNLSISDIEEIAITSATSLRYLTSVGLILLSNK